MDVYALSKDALDGFVAKLMAKSPVIGPVAKRTRFVFSELASVDELRLDYDTTILPPKRIFFPPQQAIIRFTGTTFESCVAPREQVLFGVHPHDVKAIDMADQFYSENNPDGDYLENRRSTTIVAMTVQNHYPYAFFGTACQECQPKGHDMLMTAIKDAYVFEVCSDRGKAMLARGDFTPATSKQLEEAEAAKRKADLDCPKKLHNTSEEIRLKVRDHFDDAAFWNACSRDCFSCGSCNTVCPTCYCFDVQDEWNIDGVSGVRQRTWDACLTCEFAEVSVQNRCENFRDTPAKRFPHRIMRKTTYMNEQFGGPACVGCGRCSGACTARIADPTTIINTLMER